jgi:ATP-dependent helicase/nuclease subunit B
MLGAWTLDAFRDVAREPKATVDGYVNGPALPTSAVAARADDGTPAVWVIDGAIKRHVVDPASLAAWRLNVTTQAASKLAALALPAGAGGDPVLGPPAESKGAPEGATPAAPEPAAPEPDPRRRTTAVGEGAGEARNASGHGGERRRRRHGGRTSRHALSHAGNERALAANDSCNAARSARSSSIAAAVRSGINGRSGTRKTWLAWVGSRRRLNDRAVASIASIGSAPRARHVASHESHGERVVRPLVGWGLGGPNVRPQPPGECARLGAPAWSPAQLLRDLHLRMGLPQTEASVAERVPMYRQRLDAIVKSAPNGAQPFYARSFAVDSLGTAKMLLAWRDGLVDAGWDGKAVAGGGDRLDALAAIEGEPLPIGKADRLVRLEEELRRSSKHHVYASITLVEERTLWSRRWQSVFALLEERGCLISQLVPELAAAPATTDLGVLQQMLRGEIPSRRAKEGSAVKGDGTLLLLRGDTPGDLAELTAALLAKHRDAAVVVRCAGAEVLDPALARHGLPQQGCAASSAWRPAMQLLPLALELAYEPRDPYRVLELVTLPVGPFQGMLGALLARAVSKQPGVGGTEWIRQKATAIERLRASRLRVRAAEGIVEPDADADADVAERMQRVTDWVEAPGAPTEGAPRAWLLAVANRVRSFLQKRFALDDGPAIYGAAFSQAQAMTDALARDHRDLISREEMRHLLDSVVRGEDSLDLSIERAGRIDHVDHPSALLAPATTVVFWGFVSGTEHRPTLPPWHRAERVALEAAGVTFPDPGKLLTVESDAWRRGILAARERVIFVVPATIMGAAVAPHPTWDEIAARLGIEDEKAAACLTHYPQALLAANDESLVALGPLEPLLLPEGRGQWSIPAARIAAAADLLQTSATALDTLASCPLRFVLSRYAKLRSGALAKVASGPLLNGSLGHRLVEELHREKAFDLDDDPFAARSRALLDALLRTEGATLLLEGAAFERSQLVPQLVKAMRELRRYLVESGWHIKAVEEVVATSSAIGTLSGRLDVRLENAEGQQAVLDLKWGASSYKELLEGGRAVQLAAYVHAIHPKGSKHSLPPAAYFALGAAKVLTADTRMGMGESKTLEGATLADTWRRVEKTARAVQESLRAGKIYVAASKGALPLLEALTIPESERATHYAIGKPDDACKYCDYPAICGRAWEAVR